MKLVHFHNYNSRSQNAQGYNLSCVCSSSLDSYLKFFLLSRQLKFSFSLCTIFHCIGLNEWMLGLVFILESRYTFCIYFFLPPCFVSKVCLAVKRACSECIPHLDTETKWCEKVVLTWNIKIHRETKAFIPFQALQWNSYVVKQFLQFYFSNIFHSVNIQSLKNLKYLIRMRFSWVTTNNNISIHYLNCFFFRPKYIYFSVYINILIEASEHKTTVCLTIKSQYTVKIFEICQNNASMLW